jgi:large subunit ribosomal protein L31
MAKSTNVTYYSDATATCSNCKSVYTLGLTTESIQLEICGNCHPFYTGKESFIDTAGRIQKFQAKLDKVGDGTPKKKKKAKKVRKYAQTLDEFANNQSGEAELTVDVKGADSL